MWPHREETLEKLAQEAELEKTQRTLLMQPDNPAASESEKLQRLVEEATAKHQKTMITTEDHSQRRLWEAKDASRRAFYREFKQVVQAADVILQVLDARDPLGCRVAEVERMVMEQGGSGKRLVLVLNKIDLVPRPVIEGWLKHLRREFPTVAFKASTQQQRQNLGQGNSLSSDCCLGADTLVQLLKNYSRSQNLKTCVTVGVVGYPNVGKSSLINSLKRSKVCRVGASPGVTTARQEIHLDRNIKLLDCPGIVFADDSQQNHQQQMFLRNCLRVEQVEDPISPVGLILDRCDREQLMLLYQIPAFISTDQFLHHLATRQGKLRKGGLPNIEAAARIVLQDWNAGKIPYYTLPPSDSSTSTTAVIVPSFAPEFDLEQIEEMELTSVLPFASSFAENTLDCMEVDEDATKVAAPAPPQIVELNEVIRKRQSKKDHRKDDDGWTVRLSPQEALLNPQTNRQRQKAAKKLASKSKSNNNNNNDDDDDANKAEDYDFSIDYK